MIVMRLNFWTGDVDVDFILAGIPGETWLTGSCASMTSAVMGF